MPSTTLTADILLTTNALSASSPDWVLDSGATHYYCNNPQYFLSGSLKQCAPITIQLGDNSTVIAMSHGMITLNPTDVISALYVASFRLSLFSIPLFDQQGWSIAMLNQTCIIKDTNDYIIMSASMANNLY
jgi:hypothetical protein